jgi:cell division protein FtsA
MLNGGIVLTGGGAQLQHLIQLTEYVTGISARIGYPTEHLAPGHLEELSQPMYSTCLGLILKGYDDYDRNPSGFEKNYLKYSIQQLPNLQTEEAPQPEPREEESVPPVVVKDRTKGLKGLWGSVTNGLIDMFKEDDDTKLNNSN